MFSKDPRWYNFLSTISSISDGKLVTTIKCSKTSEPERLAFFEATAIQLAKEAEKIGLPPFSGKIAIIPDKYQQVFMMFYCKPEQENVLNELLANCKTVLSEQGFSRFFEKPAEKGGFRIAAWNWRWKTNLQTVTELQNGTHFSQTQRVYEKKPPIPLPMASNLYVDLVPSSAWFSNLRSELKKEEWDVVRKKAYAAADHVCQACGKQGHRHPVECHERWAYNEQTGVQTLVGLVALCPRCHGATHYGHAQIAGREEVARAQFRKVRGWTDEELDAHISQAFADFKRRSAMQWTLDARWLLSYTDELSDETIKKILPEFNQKSFMLH